MSQQSVASSLTTVDWSVVAAASATFLGTIVTVVWGWIGGKVKAHEHIRADGTDVQIAGAVLQDNLSLRENSQSNRDLRDQVCLLIHTQEQLTRGVADLNRSIEELTDTLKDR